MGGRQAAGGPGSETQLSPRAVSRVPNDSKLSRNILSALGSCRGGWLPCTAAVRTACWQLAQPQGTTSDHSLRATGRWGQELESSLLPQHRSPESTWLARGRAMWPWGVRPQVPLSSCQLIEQAQPWVSRALGALLPSPQGGPAAKCLGLGADPSSSMFELCDFRQVT